MIKLNGIKSLPKITHEEMENMVPLNNYVLFQPERNSDELKTKSNIYLNPDEGSKQGRNMCTRGTILKMGQRTKWGRASNLPWTYCAEEVKEGDKVWAGNDAIIQAYELGFSHGLQRVFQVEETEHALMLHFCHLTAVRKNKWLQMLNGWLLVKLLDERVKTRLYLPEHLKDKRTPTFAEVVAVNPNPVEYFSWEGQPAYPDDNEIPVSVGDVVMLDKHCDIPFESELDLTFGEPYCRVQRRNIIAIIEGYDKAAIETKNQAYKGL